MTLTSSKHGFSHPTDKRDSVPCNLSSGCVAISCLPLVCSFSFLFFFFSNLYFTRQVGWEPLPMTTWGSGSDENPGAFEQLSRSQQEAQPDAFATVVTQASNALSKQSKASCTRAVVCSCNVQADLDHRLVSSGHVFLWVTEGRLYLRWPRLVLNGWARSREIQRTALQRKIGNDLDHITGPNLCETKRVVEFVPTVDLRVWVYLKSPATGS